MASDLPEPAAPLPDFSGASGGAPGTGAAMLDKRTKAAIVVQFLLRDGIELSLTSMRESAQAELIRAVGTLTPVDTATVNAVLDEFADALEAGGMPGGGGLAAALELLEGAVSPAIAHRLRAQEGIITGGDPWARIVEQDAEGLVPIFERESVEVAAVLLSKLAVGKAAEALGLLPGARARRITYAVSQIGAARPDAVARIGRALARGFDIVPETAFSGGPVERVGAILNSTRAMTRNDVLEGLEETDAAFAEEVRRAIFTFANIPGRIDTRDVPKIVRQVEQDVLVMALAAALPDLEEAVEFILGAMSKRMAEALRGEMDELGEVDADAGEDAMGALVAVIRELEEAGEIHLIADG
ncbi:MAG: FliG C-terminal domain-containing protein [Pseudomonadota bacterium]